MEEDLDTKLLVLQSHLDGMLSCIKRNSITLKKFQQFEMRLLQLDSLSEIIDHILYDAKNYFDLDVIGLCLVDELGEIAELLEAEGKNAKFREGLVLLQDKSPLQSIFGNAMRPYLGSYKPHAFANFFPVTHIDISSVALTPFNRRGKYLGSLNIGSHQADRFSSTMATDFVAHLGSIASVCLENILNFENIKRTSHVDILTGVNNRRFFEQRIVEELDRCQRNAEPISCLFLDIDHFKRINDKYGHQAGDLVLSLTAKAIKTQLRNNDVLARYGGEEFVALLSNINNSKAIEIAERIRKSIEALSIRFNDDLVKVTVSIGLSEHIPDRNSP
ncbi:MAG: diguanylate cyclase, partial [Gammaproteobacteria bacterium]